MMNNSDTIIPFIISRIDLKMKKCQKKIAVSLDKKWSIPYNKSIEKWEVYPMKIIEVKGPN